MHRQLMEDYESGSLKQRIALAVILLLITIDVLILSVLNALEV